MKNLLKIFLLYMIALGGELYGQATPITVTNGVIALKGKGKLGGNKDGYQYYQYNTPVSGNFYLQAYFRSLTNSSQSYTGLAFRNIATYQKTDGGVASVMMVYQNDSLKCLIKSAYNQKAVAFLISANIKIPGYLKLVKEGNDAKFYYSSQSESDVTINFILLGSVQDAFLGWTNITQNFITGGNNGVVQTALASKRVYGSLGNAPPVAPTLASNPTNPVAGSSVTFTASGCAGTIGFFKNNIAITGSNPLTVSSPVVSDYYSAKCVVGGVNSVASNEILIGDGQVITGSGIVNTLVDINLPTETMWNRFQPDLIPDFIPAKSIDPKTGQNLPNKWFIWHAPYRNLFGDTEYDRLVKMSKKGVTAWNISKLPLPPYNSQMQSVITPERIVGENYGLGKINGLHPEEQNWTNWTKWAKDGVSNASTYGATSINGKYNQLLTISDYENLHTNLTTQTSSNFHTVALNSMADIAVGCVGFQYGAALNTLGYYTSNLYNGSNNVWATPADSNVPSQFIGKSSATNNKIVGVNEITYALEAILPEGFQVQDQNNQNWFTIKHFGAELDNTYNGGNLNGCNAQHWATNVGVGVETMVNAHRAYPNGGQYVIAQLKNGNETDNGFHYDGRYAQFRGNKFANYVNRYAVTNIRDVYDTNGNKIGTEDYLQPMGSEYISNFMAEGQVFTAYFCGAKGINLWNSDFTDVAIPKTKTVNNPRQGAKHNDVNYGNRDLESYLYTLKALWRLNQKVLLSNGQSYSFNEICDGSEVYLNQATKVVYPGSSTITQLRALDWQISKKSPVRAVVNAAKNVVFVLAFQAYAVEDNSVTFKLTDYGANITEVINIPAGKIIVKAYPLVGGVSQGGTIPAPVISANPTTPTAGSSVTFSSTACSGGTVKWFVDDAQLSTGLSYTVTNPIANVTYKATCTVNGVSSVTSNGITIAAAPVTTGVTITEPARTQYFYSNGQSPSFYSTRANLPAIITNTATFEEADVVKLKNSEVEFWFNLRRGGQICYASKASVPINRVYNGYDGGFQWVYDGAQYLVDGKLNGSFPDQTNNNINYNTTMGGDFQNHSQTLIDYHPVGTNGYYIKFRPILYNFISRVSEVEIEVTYTLVGKSLKADYKYTSFRTDSNLETGNDFRFMGFHIPICFLTNNFTKYAIYEGDSPWTTSGEVGLTKGDIPNITGGAAQSLGANSKEFAGIVYDPANNFAVGVMNNSEGTQRNVTYEQLNKFSGGNAGTVFSGPYTTMALAESFSILNGGNYVRNSTAYFTLGNSIGEVRDELKIRAGH